MLFLNQNVKSEDLNNIQNFFAEFDSQIKTVSPDEADAQSSVSKYITSLVSNQYQKSVEDIQNTKVGAKRIRKRNLQQVMQESFFSGSNRFGNNFIA